MKSIREIYKIGKGPSSSHTMGPERAAKLFKEKNPQADAFKVILYGSLSKTGVGHGTDRVLLDVKYTDGTAYFQHVGCSMEAPLRFLAYLNEHAIPTTLRQVIIPTLNDTEESVQALLSIAKAHPCVDWVELLPFRKICQTKYDNMHISFPFGHLPEPGRERMQTLRSLLGAYGG